MLRNAFLLEDLKTCFEDGLIEAHQRLLLQEAEPC